MKSFILLLIPPSYYDSLSSFQLLITALCYRSCDSISWNELLLLDCYYFKNLMVDPSGCDGILCQSDWIGFKSPRDRCDDVTHSHRSGYLISWIELVLLGCYYSKLDYVGLFFFCCKILVDPSGCGRILYESDWNGFKWPKDRCDDVTQSHHGRCECVRPLLSLSRRSNVSIDVFWVS